MRDVLLVVSFILTIPNSYCQITVNTIPEQINGESSLILGVENSNDVKIVCEIFYHGNPFLTNWRLLSGGDTFLLTFHANGTGNNDLSLQFSITGEPAGSQTTQANLTIIDFTSSLNVSVLECFSSGITLGSFTLRLIGIYTL